jgi:predicted nuclease of restriction endonuclease-like (RecB) superfamily
MTCAQVLEKVKAEIALSIATINELRVHDDRIRGQLESLFHIRTVLEHAESEMTIEPAATPAPVERQRVPIKAPIKTKAAKGRR